MSRVPGSHYGRSRAWEVVTLALSALFAASVVAYEYGPRFWGGR